MNRRTIAVVVLLAALVALVWSLLRDDAPTQRQSNNARHQTEDPSEHDPTPTQTSVPGKSPELLHDNAQRTQEERGLSRPLKASNAGQASSSVVEAELAKKSPLREPVVDSMSGDAMVLDDRNTPRPDAQLQVRGSNVFTVLRSSGQGTHRVEGFKDADTEVMVQASHPTFAPGPWVSLSAGALVSVPLGARTTLHGRVVHASTGAPVTGFFVEVRSATSSTESLVDKRNYSDAEGRFEIDAELVEGAYRLQATAVLLRPSPFQEVTLSRGERREVVFSLDGGGALLGRVLDAETQEPLAGVKIGHGGTLGKIRGLEGLPPLITDDAGVFQLTGFDTRPTTIYLQHRGYVSRRAHIQVPSDKTLERDFFIRKVGEDGLDWEAVDVGLILEEGPGGGVLVKGFEDGSPALGQLEIGDRLVSVDGHPVGETREAWLALGGIDEGTAVTLLAERGSSRFEVVLERVRRAWTR